MSGGHMLSPEDYAAPSLDDAPETATPVARATPGAKPDLHKAVAFAAAHFDVDPNVMAGMLMRESNLDPDVISGKRSSRAGTVGIAQFMPDTAKRYGIDPTDPVQSIMGMGAYLRDNLNKFGGDYEKAIAGYNWGENRKDFDAPEWKRKLPAETADYVGFVTAFARGMRGDAPGTAQDPARKPLPADVTPSAAGAGRGVVNRGLVQPDAAPLDSPSSDPMGSGASEIMAQPMSAPLVTRDPLSRAREPGSFDPGNAADLVQMSKSPQTLARERVALQMEASRSGAPTLKASPDASVFRNAMDATIAKPLDRSLPAAAVEVAGDAARGVAGSSQILAGSVWSGLQAVADAAGGNEFARFAGEAGRAAREARTLGNNAAGPTSLTKQIFESTFTSVPMMLAFSAAPLKAMMAQSAANEYGESADRGAGIEERTQRAVVMGLAEGIGERFGLPQLQSLFAKAAAKASTKELGHVLADMLVKEQIGEQVTQALQSGYEVAGQYGLKPDMTLPQYIDDAVNTAKVTFGQSLLTGGMAGGVKAMQGRPAISAADLARSKGFLDNGPGPATAPALTSTSFTPADSPSARAGLVDIVVPDAAPAARVTSEPLAEATLPLGTDISAVNGDTDPAPPAPQSAEQAMAARLAAQFGIPPEEALRAQPVEARGQVDRRPVADETQNAAATSEAVSAAPGNHNADTATPTETWVGRRGDGYTTRGDAEQAINGREKRFPDLTWKVEATSGGRFQLAGYAATTQFSPTTDRPIQQSTEAAEHGRPQPDAMGRAVSTVRSPPAAPALGAAATAQPAFEFNRNADGTVTVKGDSAAIKAALPGFSGMPSKGGVLFGTRVADQVIEQLSPAQTASEALATAAPATVFKSRK